jgi:WD40 repeat protein
VTTLQIIQQYEIALDPSPSFPFDTISAIAFHEPGDLIVPGYESGRVSIVRKSTGSIVCTLPTTSSEKTPVKAIAISPDGKHLAKNGSHHTVELWDLPSFTQRGRYYGHRAGMWGRQGMVTSLSWAPDCLHIASGSSDGTLHIWNALSLHHLGTFVERGMNELPSMPVTALSWSPDGALLADATTGMLRVWDASGHLQHIIESPLEGKTITAIVWVPDETGEGNTLLFACDDGTIQHYSPLNSTCSDLYKAHTCIRTITSFTWLDRQQQGQLAYLGKSATTPLLHLQQFSLSQHTSQGVYS